MRKPCCKFDIAKWLTSISFSLSSACKDIGCVQRGVPSLRMNVASCLRCWAQLVVDAQLTPLQSNQDYFSVLENGGEKARYVSTEGLCYRRVRKKDLIRLSLLRRVRGELYKGYMVLLHLRASKKWASPCLPANSGREHCPFTKHL